VLRDKTTASGLLCLPAPRKDSLGRSSGWRLLSVDRAKWCPSPRRSRFPVAPRPQLRAFGQLLGGRSSRCDPRSSGALPPGRFHFQVSRLRSCERLAAMRSSVPIRAELTPVRAPQPGRFGDLLTGNKARFTGEPSASVRFHSFITSASGLRHLLHNFDESLQEHLPLSGPQLGACSAVGIKYRKSRMRSTALKVNGSGRVVRKLNWVLFCPRE
jgi:hypothetical protein